MERCLIIPIFFLVLMIFSKLLSISTLIFVDVLVDCQHIGVCFYSIILNLTGTYLRVRLFEGALIRGGAHSRGRLFEGGGGLCQIFSLNRVLIEWGR